MVVNDDEEWEFLAEGGMHLVFTNGTRILRINKEPPHSGDDKVTSSSSSTTTKNENHDPPPRHHDTAASSPYGDSTISDQLCRHLSPYTDVPKLRKLALNDHCVVEKVAAARLLWNDEGGSGGSSCILQSQLVFDDDEILAQELPDYRRGGGSSRLSSSTTATTLCLELKPKAGYIAISPLVHEDRFVKYSTTRFELQQRLYQAGMIRKRWMAHDQSTTTATTISNSTSTSCCTTTTTSGSRSRSWYNPLDLFSGETHCIRQALVALFQCPQNNIKVWRNQHGTGGEGAHNIDSVSDTARSGTASMRAAESVMFDDDQKNGAVPSVLDGGGRRLLDLVAAILTREPFLNRVLRWQTLDVIDADGAILIYERLIHTYCHGCAVTAEAMVNNVKWKEDDDDTTAVIIHDLLRHSPIIYGGGASGDTRRIVQYCDEVQSLQRHLVGDQQQQDPSSHQQCLENVRTAARRILSEFQPDDCCYLLQCWLLSLGACDLSFFVTMMRRVDDGDNNNHSCSTTDDRLQTATRPGCVVYDNDHYFEYELKCIDYDFKPAKKLRSLQERERQINTISASPLT
jgi:Inositol-pentakisphosphate 2-kinase